MTRMDRKTVFYKNIFYGLVNTRSRGRIKDLTVVVVNQENVRPIAPAFHIPFFIAVHPEKNASLAL